MRIRILLLVAGVLLPYAVHGEEKPTTDFQRFVAQRAASATEAREASRFSAIRHDFFSRFNRDPEARAGADEIEIDHTWTIVLPDDADPLVELMGGEFNDFMRKRMGVSLALQIQPRADLAGRIDNAVVLLDTSGGDTTVSESYTMTVSPGEIRVTGVDPAGLRDGIVKLIDLIGFREAPLLPLGEQVYRPRIAVRFGSHGSPRDNILMGYNALIVGGGNSLNAISTSQAIPELVAHQQPGVLLGSLETAREARRYGMKTYFSLEWNWSVNQFGPAFQAHPDIRGAEISIGQVLCTEHPLVARYLSETIEGIFRADPKLDGLYLIVGGEGFYHCFMRPVGAAAGHTNCPRCESLGAEAVVSNLCNTLAAASRRINPDAETIAWVYSADIWSADPAHLAFIQHLKPGTAIMTDIVKGEWMTKPNGLKKKLWDYSIDLIGPSHRVQEQIRACKHAGIPIYLLTMCENSVEYPNLPHIPCMDRWAARGEVMVDYHVDGVLGGHFANYDATSASEIYKHLWWEPAPDKESLLQGFAVRLAGEEAGPHLRNAWRYASKAIDYSPQVGNYYLGPHYLGPAHPMCVDPEAPLPDSFYGTIQSRDRHSVFITAPTLTGASGTTPQAIEYYRRMKNLLQKAVSEMERARPLVPERCVLMFDAEYLSIQWFYRTVRTELNFYESCYLRDQLLTLASQESIASHELDEARQMYARWLRVLRDEQANATDAIPLMEADARLDFYKRKDSVVYHHGGDMIRAKLELIDREINETLPALAQQLNLYK